jgi:hypothetical protein
MLVCVHEMPVWNCQCMHVFVALGSQLACILGLTQVHYSIMLQFSFTLKWHLVHNTAARCKET